MNTKLKNTIINPEYEGLFSFDNNAARLEHSAQMISYKVLSEVEKICDAKGITKKDLADLVNTSKSYITQLFRGVKQVNTQIIAKFEDVLDISFEIKAKPNEATYAEFYEEQITSQLLTHKRMIGKKGAWYYCPYSEKEQVTSEIIHNMQTDNVTLQKVV